MIHWISGFVGGVLFLSVAIWWILGDDRGQD